MLFDIINGLVGLILGVLAGWLLQRGATQEARAHNRELTEELTRLRVSIYARSGDRGDVAPADVPGTGEAEIREFLLSRQDAEGRVSRSALVERYVGLGMQQSQIDEILDALQERGEIVVHPSVVEVR